MTHTRDEVQAMYDELGTQHAVARRLGRSTADIGAYLRTLGVVTKPRGGARRTTAEPKVVCQKEPITAPPMEPAVKARVVPIQVRECRARHLKLNPHFTKFPVPCVKHDLMPHACEACKERYTTQVVRSGSSMGGVVNLVSGV